MVVISFQRWQVHLSWIRGFQKDYFGRRQKLFFWLLIQTKMVTGYVLCFKEILLVSERSLSIFFFSKDNFADNYIHSIWCQAQVKRLFLYWRPLNISYPHEVFKWEEILHAGHSMHLMAVAEALTNVPSEHCSNLKYPTLWLANPACLKAVSSCIISQESCWEISMYSESSCPTPLNNNNNKKRIKKKEN